ncbi:AI-2E family transporter [candidate division KSB1 bacterium]|nr:AI-2E family transporter [candidate division KSB1 bacterium]
MSNENSTISPAALPNEVSQLKAEKFSRYFLVVVLIGIALTFYNMVKIFIIPVFLAAVFAGLFYPLYQFFLKLFRNRQGLSAFVCCLILLLVLLIPTYLIANLVSMEAIDFYQSGQEKIAEIINKGDRGILGKIKNYEWFRRLKLDEFDWQSEISGVAQNLAGLMATFINKASKETFQLITDLFFIFFAMYYFFRDGQKLIQRLKYLSPLADRYEEELISRFIAVSKATIKGTLVIGLIKGIMGALTFWIFGISSPILWGMVMVILSFLPMIGAWLVMYPAAIIQMILGNVWQGIAVFLIAALIIGNIDNFLTPKLVGREAGMHDLLIFFSTIGGISLFGVMGFIVGPIIAALFLTMLDVYSKEFKSQLDLAQQITMPPPPAEPLPTPPLPPPIVPPPAV